MKIEEKKIFSSVKDIPKNSIFAEFAGAGGVMTLNYERLFALSEKAGLTLRAGAGYPSLLMQVTIIYGGVKNYMEFGLASAYNFDSFHESFHIGYRFQASNGLLLRASPMLYYSHSNKEKSITFGFGLSIGYSF